MAQGRAVRALTAAGRAFRRASETARRASETDLTKTRLPDPTGLGNLKPRPKKPTEKDVKKAKELRAALESGRAEAKPGAKLLDLGPPLTLGIPEMTVPNPRMVRRIEIQAANDAIKKSLRESKGRRAAAKESGRASKRKKLRARPRLKLRPSHRTANRSGGR